MTSSDQLTLIARINPSAADSRRGIVRVHPEVLIALGLREWDGISITGARVTAAVVAATDPHAPTGIILLDDITFANAGVRENASVVISATTVRGASRVIVTGSAVATHGVDDTTLRRALLGKVLSVGDTVSLLPRDLGPELTAGTATRALTRSVGITWTNELLTVTAVEPQSPVSVQPTTAVRWAEGARAATPQPPVTPQSPATPTVHQVAPVVPSVSPTPPTVRPVAELVGVDSQIAKLRDWLTITLDEPEVLRALGALPRLGVLLSGPAGAGKTTLVRSVCAHRRVITIDGPTTGALDSSARLAAIVEAIDGLRQTGSGVLLITDADTLLPANAEPVSALILDRLRTAISPADADDPRIALIVTTTEPARLDTRLRAPDLCDREVVIGLPDATQRARLLRVIVAGVPFDGNLEIDEIASRTPGFVAGDLAALVRDAALRAAARAAATGSEPALIAADLAGALEVIRPVSRLDTPEVNVGSVTLDDVGDMTETKQALTEAVLWPLQHPDTFTRLGVDPPRGVLLFGPPGCGKTFVVRALAASGRLSVHTVKGAELMDKWVGASEKAVRDLFSRARESAPSLIFLDEVDALAPRRGQSTDSGVGDRVVAALLTELDGVQPLQDVVVLGATNRPDLIDPALLRPGRLERLVFVPPPDGPARADILRTAGRRVPLAADVDLDVLADELDGYSAADCSALLREAALAAMRTDIDAATVTAADIAEARARVRPSLDAEQVENLRSYAQRRLD
ncbi:MAG: AAA family ATPase [Gordonia sp. (in: high G+C Gram-positive bacteria)]